MQVTKYVKGKRRQLVTTDIPGQIPVCTLWLEEEDEHSKTKFYLVKGDAYGPDHWLCHYCYTDKKLFFAPDEELVPLKKVVMQ